MLIGRVWRRQSIALFVLLGLVFTVDLSDQFLVQRLPCHQPSRRISSSSRRRPWRLASPRKIQEDYASTNRQAIDEGEYPLTTALLRISYDGSRFMGWSAANDGPKQTANNSSSTTTIMHRPIPRRGRKRGKRFSIVRSVQGVLQQNLAKLYGNVDPSRIVIEGCSRTDKGVHARYMVAQFYCLTPKAAEILHLQKQANNETSKSEASSLPPAGCIPGKRLPHPRNATDASWFVPLPMSLSRMSFALNRMCYDMRVMAVAPTPTRNTTLPDPDDAATTTIATTYNQLPPKQQVLLPFHPTLAATSKTYQYTLSVGRWHDPTQYKRVWHVGNYVLDVDRMRQAAALLLGTHNFTAFQGAPRGTSDKRQKQKQKQNEACICTVESVDIETTTSAVHPHAAPDTNAGIHATTTLVVTCTGDRFLYKMMRFLVGALVAIGMNAAETTTNTNNKTLAGGLFELSDLQVALETGVRPVNAFECAPAKGLVLHRVGFDNDVPINWQAASS